MKIFGFELKEDENYYIKCNIEYANDIQRYFFENEIYWWNSAKLKVPDFIDLSTYKSNYIYFILSPDKRNVGHTLTLTYDTTLDYYSRNNYIELKIERFILQKKLNNKLKKIKC